MTLPDCESLCKSLRLKTVSSTLKSLKIHSSNIDDDKMILLASAILDNKTLTNLGINYTLIIY
jgi:hypothetical protein